MRNCPGWLKGKGLLFLRDNTHPAQRTMKKLLAMWAEGSYLIVLTALIRSYSSEFYLFDPIKEAIHVNQVVKEEVKNRLRDQGKEFFAKKIRDG